MNPAISKTRKVKWPVVVLFAAVFGAVGVVIVRSFAATPPLPPTNLRAEAFIPTQIKLLWEANANGTEAYLIKRDGVEAGNIDAKNICRNGQCSFTDTGLIANHAYNYQLVAIGDSNAPSEPTSLKVTTPLYKVGDLNRDDVVNALDLAIALRDVGKSGAEVAGDANNDSKVDAQDAALVAKRFGGGQ